MNIVFVILGLPVIPTLGVKTIASSVRSPDRVSTFTDPGMTQLNDSPRAVSSSPRRGRTRKHTVNVDVSMDVSRLFVVDETVVVVSGGGTCVAACALRIILTN